MGAQLGRIGILEQESAAGGGFFSAIVQHSLETTTGNQTIAATAADGWTEGQTPKAAIFVFGYAETNGTARAPLAAGFGATAATNQRAVGTNARDGESVSTTKAIGVKDEVIIMLDGDGDIEIRANFVEFGTDSVTVNVTVASGSFEVPDFMLVNVILLGGDDVSNVTVGSKVLATENNTVTVTTGHDNNMLFFFSPIVTMDGTLQNIATASVGFGSRDGATIGQGAFAFRLDAPTTDNSILSDGGVVQRPSGANSGYASMENFSGTSFDLRSNGADMNTIEAAYISVELANGRKAFADVFDSPTVTGDHDFTKAGIDFTPVLGLMLPTMMTAANVTPGNGEGGSLGLSMFNGDNALSYDWSAESGGSLSDTQSLADDQMFNVADDAGANAFTGTFSQMLSNGARANFTAADGTVRKWIGMFVG